MGFVFRVLLGISLVLQVLMRVQEVTLSLSSSVVEDLAQVSEYLGSFDAHWSALLRPQDPDHGWS